MNKNQDWIARQEKSRKIYEYERLLVIALDEIHEAMERNGMTKADVARALGTSRAHVTQVFSGSRNVTLRSLSDLAWACGARLSMKWQPLRSGEFISSPVSVVAPIRRVVTVEQSPNACPANDIDIVAAGGGS